MANVRLHTPSGNIINSRFRCVLVGSVFFGTMVRSICADIPLSAPFAFSKCNTQYPMMLSFYSCRLLSFIFLILSVRRKMKCVSACPFLHADRLGRGVQRGATPLAYWEIFSGHGVKREENPLISYGIFSFENIRTVLTTWAFAPATSFPYNLKSPRFLHRCCRLDLFLRRHTWTAPEYLNTLHAWKYRMHGLP